MTYQTRAYSLLVEPDEEGGYLAYFPALTGCHTSAETYEDAVKNAEEVLLGCLEALRKNGEEIPFEEYLSNEVSLGVMAKLPAAS
jgi:predicted RNase H-like HicB family nuclease